MSAQVGGAIVDTGLQGAGANTDVGHNSKQSRRAHQGCGGGDNLRAITISRDRRVESTTEDA